MSRVARATAFGADHAEPDAVAVRGLPGGRVWHAISVGGRAALARKPGAAVPNEDALLVAESSEHVLLAVADGHFGPAASHALVARLDRALAARASSAAPLPQSAAELRSLVLGCAEERGANPSGSATTLTVAVLARGSREVFGLAAGDSPAIAAGARSGVRELARATRRYVDPFSRRGLAAGAFEAFEARLEPGDFLAVFTDGVNECRYRRPEESIGARHIEACRAEAGESTERFVASLARLALDGVDGHPGGEDNLALAAVRA